MALNRPYTDMVTPSSMQSTSYLLLTFAIRFPRCSIASAASASSITQPPLLLSNSVRYSICAVVGKNVIKEVKQLHFRLARFQAPKALVLVTLLRTMMGTMLSVRAQDRTYLVLDLGPSPSVHDEDYAVDRGKDAVHLAV